MKNTLKYVSLISFFVIGLNVCRAGESEVLWYGTKGMVLPNVESKSAVTTLKSPSLGTDSTPPIQDQLYNTYVNSTIGIKITYPKNWTNEIPQNVSAVEKIFAPLIGFYAPIETLSSKSQGSLTISVVDLSKTLDTLDNFFDSSITQIKQPANGIDNIETSYTAIANFSARRAVYMDKSGDNKGMQVYTVRNNHAYVFTYTAKSNHYQKYLSTIEKMLDSVEFSSS